MIETEQITELTAAQKKKFEKQARQGRARWNECFGDQVEAKKNWQRIAFCSLSIAALAVGGVIHLGSLPKEVAYVVEKDKLGHIIYAGKAQDQPLTANDWDDIYTTSLQNLVRDWRSVTSDRSAQDAAWDRAYTSIGAGSQAKSVLDQFYADHNPNSRAADGTLVQVQMETTDRRGDRSYGIWWKETTTNLAGEVKSVQHWRCQFTFVKLSGVHFRVTEMQLDAIQGRGEANHA